MNEVCEHKMVYWNLKDEGMKWREIKERYFHVTSRAIQRSKTILR